MAELEGCPDDYVWSNTGESYIRVVQRADGGPQREQYFPELWPEEILFAASMNLKLEQVFHQLQERFRRLYKEQKLSCLDIWALGNTDKPDTRLHAQYFMFAWRETLYSL